MLGEGGLLKDIFSAFKRRKLENLQSSGSKLFQGSKSSRVAVQSFPQQFSEAQYEKLVHILN